LIPFKSRKTRANGHSQTIDAEELKAEVVVIANPDAYLDEYADSLGSKRSTIAYNLKKLKISRKKNHAVRRTRRGKTQEIQGGTGNP
jgi:predicted transcriptional regulator